MYLKKRCNDRQELDSKKNILRSGAQDILMLIMELELIEEARYLVTGYKRLRQILWER